MNIFDIIYRIYLNLSKKLKGQHGQQTEIDNCLD